MFNINSKLFAEIKTELKAFSENSDSLASQILEKMKTATGEIHPLWIQFLQNKYLDEGCIFSEGFVYILKQTDSHFKKTALYQDIQDHLKLHHFEITPEEIISYSKQKPSPAEKVSPAFKHIKTVGYFYVIDLINRQGTALSITIGRGSKFLINKTKN